MRCSGSTVARFSTSGGWRADLPHQLVHVLELLERRPVLIAAAPVRSRIQPHRERLGEVLVGMALRVPVVDVQDEAAAVRLRRVELRVVDRRGPEQRLAAPAAAQHVGVVDRVTELVTQDAHAPRRRAPLDFEHLLALEPGEPRVRQVERNRDAGHAVGREPLVRQPEMRAEDHAALGQLRLEVADALLQRAAIDREIELRHPQVEELVVSPLGPERRLAPRPRRRHPAARRRAALRPARVGRVAPGRPRSPFQNGLKPEKCQRAVAATVPECAAQGGHTR